MKGLVIASDSIVKVETEPRHSWGYAVELGRACRKRSSLEEKSAAGGVTVSTEFYHRSNCRLCESAQVELVVEIPPIPLAEKYLTRRERDAEPAKLYPVDLYQCLDCGHVQLLDVIHPDVLWADYTYHSGQTRGIVEHFQEIARTLTARYGLAAGSLAVDIGSNDGTLLRAFQGHGLTVLGVDPAEEIARRASENGVETVPALFTRELAQKLREQRGPADLITAFNVYAHTDDMADMTEGIRSLLAPQGLFVFEAQYLRDIVEKTLLGTIFHEHICHHSVKPMDRFLRSHGLELIDVARVSIQNGSIVGTVQHLGGGRPVSASVAQLIQEEEELKLDRPAGVRVLAERLAKLRDDMARLCRGWREQNASVAAFGAARSGPTLINTLGLGDTLTYVFDDHPQKVGRFTPGNHLEVLPTSRLLELQPDFVVILAWIHAKKIIAGNQEYLRRGGHFVICCPEVEVVGA